MFLYGTHYSCFSDIFPSVFEQNCMASKYLRVEQVKFVEESLKKNWRVQVFFKGCLPQILLGPLLNTLSHMHMCFWENFRGKMTLTEPVLKNLWLPVRGHERHELEKARLEHREDTTIGNFNINSIHLTFIFHLRKMFVNDGDRLVADGLNTADKLKTDIYIVTMELKIFLIQSIIVFSICYIEVWILRKFRRMGQNITSYAKILHHMQKLCVTDGSFTTKYFQLEKHAFQRDISFRNLSIRWKIFRVVIRTLSNMQDGTFLRK